MASEWPIKTIAECASTESYSTQIGPFGKALMADEYIDSGIPVLRGVNVNHGRFHDDDFVFINEETADRLRKFESYPGDVLLVHKGTLGQIGLMPSRRKYARYIMGNSMMRVQCDPAKLLPEYLYYWLSSVDGQHYLFSRVSQVGVPQIQTPLTTLRQAALPVPPLPEQRAITNILGTLDDKIELNRRMNETLEAMARALFKSWFVDFDSVRAKAEGREAGLPKHITDLFPDRFEDSELGEIPAGWEIGTLENYAELNSENWSTNMVPEDIEYVDLANTKWGRIETTVNYRWEDAPSRAQRVLKPGDTIIGTVRPGNGSYALIAEDGLTGSTGFAVLRPIKSEFQEYVYLAATSVDNIERLAHLADGAAYPAVRPDAVSATIVVIASETVNSHFAKVTKPIMAKIATNNQQSRTLAAMRDTLLPKLISGELRVKDVERFISEVGV